MASAMIAIEPRPNWASSGVVLTLARKLKVKIPSDQTPEDLASAHRIPRTPGHRDEDCSLSVNECKRFAHFGRERRPARGWAQAPPAATERFGPGGIGPAARGCTTYRLPPSPFAA